MFQEYNIIKQTGTTDSKFPVDKTGESTILDIYWKQQDRTRLVRAKSRNLERERSFLMVDQLPSKQKVDSTYKIRFSAECVELYPFHYTAPHVLSCLMLTVNTAVWDFGVDSEWPLILCIHKK